MVIKVFFVMPTLESTTRIKYRLPCRLLQQRNTRAPEPLNPKVNIFETLDPQISMQHKERAFKKSADKSSGQFNSDNLPKIAQRNVKIKVGGHFDRNPFFTPKTPRTISNVFEGINKMAQSVFL